MREAQEPIDATTEDDRLGRRYTHPAFGQIAAHRTTGGNMSLYGSDFVHDNSIRISIHHSELHRYLNRDSHFARRQIIEVTLSEAQWATFVSSLNHGTGTPCTLEYVQGAPMPRIAHRREKDIVKQELDERIRHVSSLFEAAIADIEANVAGLSKAKQNAVLERLRRAYKEVSDSMPFAARSFEEHMESTVEKAKVEVEAYVQNHAIRAGIAAIAAGQQPPLALPTSPKPESAE